jgi:peptidoglycan hydrolase-like protein with peptidoglycan-binding domain
VQIPITFRIQNPAFKPQVLTPRQSTVIQSSSPPQNQQYNPLVISIQENLIRLGFEPGPVDGQIGQKTQRAIEAFQRSRGLPIDGTVNQDLERALESSQPLDKVKSNKLIADKPIGRVVQVYPELNYFEFDFEGAPQIRIGDSVIIKSAYVTARVSKISGVRGSALILSGNPNSIGTYALVNKIN